MLCFYDPFHKKNKLFKAKGQKTWNGSAEANVYLQPYIFCYSEAVLLVLKELLRVKGFHFIVRICEKIKPLEVLNYCDNAILSLISGGIHWGLRRTSKGKSKKMFNTILIESKSKNSGCNFLVSPNKGITLSRVRRSARKTVITVNPLCVRFRFHLLILQKQCSVKTAAYRKQNGL